MIKVEKAMKSINTFVFAKIPKHENGRGGLFEAWKRRNLGQLEKTLVFTVSHKLLKQVALKIQLKIIMAPRRCNIFMSCWETQCFFQEWIILPCGTPLAFCIGLASCTRQNAKLCLLRRWSNMTKFMSLRRKYVVQSGALNILNNGNNFFTMQGHLALTKLPTHLEVPWFSVAGACFH